MKFVKNQRDQSNSCGSLGCRIAKYERSTFPDSMITSCCRSRRVCILSQWNAVPITINTMESKQTIHNPIVDTYIFFNMNVLIETTFHEMHTTSLSHESLFHYRKEARVNRCITGFEIIEDKKCLKRPRP